MIRISRLAATSVALFMLAGPAFAQTQPSPSHLALARDVAISSGMSRSFDAMSEPFLQQLQQMNVTRPEIRTDLEQVVAMLRPEVEQQKQKMIDNAAREKPWYPVIQYDAVSQSPSGTRAQSVLNA